MNRLQLFLAGLGVLLFTLLVSGTAVAQVQDDDWSEPYRLSSDIGSVIGAGGRLVADDYGFVQAFWIEDGFSDLRIIVQYARFDGERWSEPVDIYLSPADSTFGFLSEPVVDQDGFLHLIWTMSQTGPIFYFKAHVTNATSARNWMRQTSIEAPANRAELVVDEFGTVHIVYSNLDGKEPGVYYLRTQDGGITWSQPVWIDPDIPLDYKPARVLFKRDAETGGLHILWKYDQVVEEVGIGKDIRHVYSTDHGRSWSTPFIIDAADEAIDELRAGGMVFAVYNNQAHVVWAGTNTTRREHRYSLDGGQTWSETFRIFGELNGSAGDSLFFDGAGRLQFFGQIRFPQGMWNITWDGENWSEPSLVYLIRKTSEDEHEGIHIHAINGITRGTNELVVSFTNSPSEDQLFLYVMQRALDEVEQQDFMPLPTATPTPQPTPTIERIENVEPTPFPSQPFDANANFDPESPAGGLWSSLIPSISLVGIVFIFGMVMRRRIR